MTPRRYVKPTSEDVHVEMDGDSGAVTVTMAGWAYKFVVENPSDGAFTLTEYAPNGQWCVLAGGSEQ